MTFNSKNNIPGSLFLSLCGGASRKRLLCVFFAVMATAAAAEGLYRLSWVHKRAFGPDIDKSQHFPLYVVGGATAAGEPYSPGITLSGLIGYFFDGHINDEKIRVFNLARAGESIYSQTAALERALRLRGRQYSGVVVVYPDHEEAVSLRGGLLYVWFQEKILSRSMLLADLWYYAEKKFPWLRVRTADTYGYRLRRLLEISLNHGLTPILSTVVSNEAELSAADKLPRATSLHNELIRSLAARYSIPCVDAVQLFAARSPRGPSGGGLFSDGQRPDMAG